MEHVLHLFETTRFSNLLKIIILNEVSFTLIRNYKVLKLHGLFKNCDGSFTLIRNYKVLKLYWNPIVRFHRFYTYSKLQGSQTKRTAAAVFFLFYTYSKLQGSQTDAVTRMYAGRFYTYSKLQGSQTKKAMSCPKN